jgi:hypothetical protein
MVKFTSGFDSKWPNRRCEHHYNINTRTQHLYHAFRKHGWKTLLGSDISIQRMVNIV